MKPPKIGLALGSGAARGWCHIGVLRALDEMGIRPDVIAGCSMGALVGGAYAAGRLDQLEDWARAQTRRSMLGLIDVRLTGGGILGGAEVVATLTQLGLTQRIEDLPIPFAAIAADLQTGREVWLRDGDLATAVRASVAMPGIVSPQQIDGRWLIDGSVLNPIPVSVARALGADVVIAVNPNARMTGGYWQPGTPISGMPGWSDLLLTLPAGIRDLWPSVTRAEALQPEENAGADPKSRKEKPPETSAEVALAPVAAPAYVELVSTAIDIMSDQIRRSRLAGDAPHVLLRADLSGLAMLEFHRAAEAIDEGLRITRLQADWIRACTER